MLNTRYVRFGRKFRLSVRPSGRDFYEENISALEANFGSQEAQMYKQYIHNTEDKLYILKLNGFERFPGKLFTSTIVKRDIFRTLANLLKTLHIERKPDLCTETVETTSQNGEFHGRQTILLNLGNS